MHRQLIVVANAAEARFFRRDTRNEPLIALENIPHPEGRFKSSDLADVEQGHAQADHHRGVSFETPQSPHEKEAARFARKVARRIDEELTKGEFKDLLLFSSPPLLGELRAALSSHAHECLSASFGVDLTKYGLSELESRIDVHLRADSFRPPMG